MDARAQDVKPQFKHAPDQPPGIEMEIVPTRAGYDHWAEFYDKEDNPLVLLE